MAFNLFQGVETKKKKRTTTPISTSKSGFNLFAPRQTTKPEVKQEAKKEPVKPRGEEIPQRPNLKNGRKLANGNVMYDKPSGGTLEYRPDGSFISRLPAHLGGGAYEAKADGSMIGTAKDRQDTRSQDLLTNKNAFDRDHIVPVSLGGISTSKTNLRQVAKDSNPKNLETQLAADVAAGRKTVNQARVEILSYKQNQLSANPVKQGVKANLLSGFKDTFTNLGKGTVNAVKNVVPGVQQTKQTFDLFRTPKGNSFGLNADGSATSTNVDPKQQARVINRSSGIAQNEAYDRSQANDLFITKKPDNFFLPSGNTQPIKDLLRATPRGIVQITQPSNELEPLEQKYPKAFRFVYGDEKLTGYSRQAAEAETQFKKDGYGKLSTPLAVLQATGTAAMDLAPLYAPALRSINDEIASVAKNMGKKEVRLTFKDLQDITSGKLTSGEKFDAFKNVAKDIDIKKALKEGGLDITKQEDTLLSRMANNPITKLGEKTPTTYSVPENSVAAVKPKEFSVKQLEGGVEKPIVKVAEKPKTALQEVKIPNAKSVKVYHGTDAEFDSFDLSKIKRNNALFFSDSKDTALGYGKNVKEAEIEFKNPLTIDAEGKTYSVFNKQIEQAISKAKEGGNDGVIFKNLSNEGNPDNYLPSTHYAVLDQSSIKTTPKESPLTTEARKPISVANSDEFQIGGRGDKIAYTERSLGEESVKFWENKIKAGERPVVTVGKGTSGNRVVVDGNHRLNAYKNLGIKDIPIVEQSPGAYLSRPKATDPLLSEAPKEKRITFYEGDPSAFDTDPTLLQKETYKDQLITELENAEAGYRFSITKDGQGSTGETIGVSSSFPEWIPDNARLSSVVKPVLKHIRNNTVPKSSRQLALYEKIAEKIEAYEKLIDETVKDVSTNGKLDIDKIDNEIEEVNKLISQAQADEIRTTQGQIKNTQSPQETGTKVAKTASDINKELVSRGFDSLPDEVLAKYTPDTKKRVMSEVSEIMEDMPKARAIISGAEDAPSNVKQVLFNSMEAYATKNNDISMLQDLASSPIASELSASAQALGASGFNKNPDSVVQVLRQIKKVREAKAVKKAGSEKMYKEKKQKVVSAIKKEVEKVNLSKKEMEWDSFISEITC